MQPSRVLLREEALGDVDEEIEIETRWCRSKTRSVSDRMEQDPRQRVFVEIEAMPVEEMFAELVKFAVVLFLRFQKQGAHHRRGGERNHHRDQDGHRQRDGKFAEEPPDNSAHEQDRE